MKCEFLNRFYSTRWTISMMELTNTKQWKNESVIDYINPWRSLILDNKDRLSEVLIVEICIQGMHWGLIYILWGTWPRTLKELVTQAHDIELLIKTNASENMSIKELENDITRGKNIIYEDKKSVTSNYTTIVFKPRYSIVVP